jgi:hypothetical protein
MAAAGVDGDDAAHGRHAAHGRVGAEEAAGSGQEAVQCGQHHAGLHSHSIVFDRENAAKVAGKVDYQTAAQRFAGQAGAGAAGVDWQLVLGRISHGGQHII